MNSDVAKVDVAKVDAAKIHRGDRLTRVARAQTVGGKPSKRPRQCVRPTVNIDDVMYT